MDGKFEQLKAGIYPISRLTAFFRAKLDNKKTYQYSVTQTKCFMLTFY